MSMPIHSVRQTVRTQSKRIVKNALRKKHDQAYNRNVGRGRILCTLRKPALRQLEQHAWQTGRKRATCLREAALAYIKNAYLPPVSLEKKAEELIFQLRKIGNNLNQLAQRCNAFKRVGVVDLWKAKARVNELEEAVETFLKTPK